MIKKLLIAGSRLAKAYLLFSRWLSISGKQRAPIRAKLILIALLICIASLVKYYYYRDMAPNIYSRNQPFFGTALSYDFWARSILSSLGHFYPSDHDPQDTSQVVYPPGYPYFVAAVYKLSRPNFFSLAIAQSVIDVVSFVIVFLIASELFGVAAAFIAATMLAVAPQVTHHSNWILPDTVGVFPILLAAYLAALAYRKENSWLWFAAGALIGLSCWIRPNPMLLSSSWAILLLLLVKEKKRAIRYGLAVIAGACLIISPITIRNCLLYKTFVPISIGAGLNLWEGIGEFGGERFGAVYGDHLVGPQEAQEYNRPDYAYNWSRPDGIERDRARVRKSLKIIINNPRWYAEVMHARMLEMLDYDKYSAYVQLKDASTKDESDSAEFYSTLFGWRGELYYYYHRGGWINLLRRPLMNLQEFFSKNNIYIAILLGIFFSLRNWRRMGLLLIVPLYYLLAQSTMHTEFRYGLPIHYFLFIIAGFGVYATAIAMFYVLRSTFYVLRSTIADCGLFAHHTSRITHYALRETSNIERRTSNVERQVPEFSLVIPLYNEQESLNKVIPPLIDELDLSGVDYQLVLVDNGSRDDTGEMLAQIAQENRRIRVARVEVNQGYGWGVITGLQCASGRLVGFMGGDGQIKPEDVVKTLRRAQSDDCDLAKVKRVVRNDGWLRKLNSRIYNLLFLTMFNVHTMDVNGTPKIFRREWLAELAPQSKDWFLDAEIMIKAKELGLRIVDVPVEFLPREKGSSHVRLGAIYEFLSNMLSYRFGRGLKQWKESKRSSYAVGRG